jgi:cardiolipin synthase
MRERRVKFAADQVFSRAAGAALLEGNQVELLCDAAENYPAWKEAIAAARSYVHFEIYIFTEDAVGQEFSALLQQKARQGVQVRVIYDWLGAIGKTSNRFWRDLRAAGAEVRAFNPPNLGEPLGWLRRDHRKCLVVDGQVAFVTGLCLGKPWTGDPEKNLAPWRDTGVLVRGPAVREVAHAFAEMWSQVGEPLPAELLPDPPAAEPGAELPDRAGDIAVRVVAASPGTGSIFRLDLAVASAAHKTLWLTDAYYAGTSSYVEALRAAAQDGVDVRLLVPGRGSDIALVQAISRAGYRSLLEAGIRVFEWNGPMIHAKSAVADGRWARVGSTNLNISSWVGNWELDLVIENEEFARRMEEQYLEDLKGATEVLLQSRRVLPATAVRSRRLRGGGGSAGRAAMGAIRMGRVLGAVMTSRLLGPAEARLMERSGLLLVALSPIAFLWPWLIAWPFALFALWLGISLVIGALRARNSPTRLAPAKPGRPAVEGITTQEPPAAAGG